METVNGKLGLPESLLYYLKKNASPNLLFKLMQTSKYFCYKEFPFIVVKYLKFEENEWYYCKNESNEIKNINNHSKPLWITKKIECFSTDDSKFISRLFLNSVVSNIEILILGNQNITINEFKFLISSANVKNFALNQCNIKHKDGSIVAVDEIVKLLPNIKMFLWILTPSTALTLTSKTTAKLIENLNPFTLKSFCLSYIPETFDINSFTKFMDANPTARYHLDFAQTISAEYSRILQTYVDKVYLKNVTKLKIDSAKSPKICMVFPRQTQKSLIKMESYFYC